VDARVPAADAFRPAWSSGRCDALGHRFVVASGAADPVLLSRLAAVTGPLRDDRAPGRHHAVRYVVKPLRLPGGLTGYEVLRDGRALEPLGDSDVAARLLQWDVNQRAVAAARRTRTVLHAAAVASGRDAVLLAAPQEHGKTTTTAGLLSSGWDYVTDEAVALDRRSLHVRPFPKALSLDRGSWPLFPDARPAHARDDDGQWLVPAAALGAATVAGDVVPRVVLLPRFRAGAPTVARALHPADALYRLAGCCFGFPGGGSGDLAVLRSLVERVPVLELTVGNLAAAVDVVADVARSAGVQPPAPGPTRPLPPAWTDPPSGPLPTLAAQRRAAWPTGVATRVAQQDALRPRSDLVVHVLADEAVVFDPASGDLHHLDRTATLVWQRLDGRRTVGTVASGLAAAAGADAGQVHDDVLTLTTQLAVRGLLHVR
jgi:hypothetical protein